VICGQCLVLHDPQIDQGVLIELAPTREPRNNGDTLLSAAWDGLLIRPPYCRRLDALLVACATPTPPKEAAASPPPRASLAPTALNAAPQPPCAGGEMRCSDAFPGMAGTMATSSYLALSPLSWTAPITFWSRGTRTAAVSPPRSHQTHPSAPSHR